MTWRQLIVWLRNLPDESATVRELDDAPEWTLTAHLLAGLIDVTAQGNWQRGGGKGPQPKPIPRPGVTSRQTRHHGQTHLSREEALRILRPERPDVEAVTDGN